MIAGYQARAFLRSVALLAALCALGPDGDAKLIPRRDPLDGALDATVIAIIRQQAPDQFRVEEVFLGDVRVGQSLSLPEFRLRVEDTSAFTPGVERIEPIHPETRILVFLKPASAVAIGSQKLGDWAVAGNGNCYFWSHDASQLASLRRMATSALNLRRSWEAARDIPDERRRAEALWPYLWNYNGSCYRQTEAALQSIGPAAGDYIAGRLEGMTRTQKDVFLNHFGSYHSERLHTALINELKRQMAAWDDLLRRRGGSAAGDEVSPPRRTRSSPGNPQMEADEANGIHGVLFQGFIGLSSFNDRSDLPFIRESALWAVRYRFKQVDDAALGAFGLLPDKDNLPVIQAIWEEFSKRPDRGNELQPFAVMSALNSHRFPETIPLMAQFVNAGFAQDIARRFLVDMTGVDFGGDTSAWLRYYESHKEVLGARK